MKNKLIEAFVLKYKNNNEIAITNKGISKNKMYTDILSMNSFIQKKVVDEKVIIFAYPYSYMFYVLFFSLVLSGKDIVIIDSFKNKDRVKEMISQSNAKLALADSWTKGLGFLLPGVKVIYPKGYQHYAKLELINANSKIYTFTSGTTGTPTLIERDLAFLSEQLALVKAHFNLSKSKILYGLLPMYNILSLVLGIETIISKKINKALTYNPDTLLVPITYLFKIKKPNMLVKYAYLGGAILDTYDCKLLKRKLPNADIEYIYGASQGALIYKTNLDFYMNNPYTFNQKIAGVDVDIDEREVVNIKGSSVVNQNYNTSDIGELIDDKLTIKGRSKYSNPPQKFYNYLFDNELRNENNNRKIFSLFYMEKIYAAYSGKLKVKRADVVYIKFHKLPFDIKHKTKLNYKEVIDCINRKEKS